MITMSNAATNASSSSEDDGNDGCNRQVGFKEGKPDARELNELAGKISAKWNNLGLQLGICQDVLSGIETNGRDRAYEMLLRWRSTTPSNALYRELYNALCHVRVGLNNVAKEFCCAYESGEGPSPPKIPKLEDSPTEQFLIWCQEQLHEFYNTNSQVKITPWDPDNTEDVDNIYIQLSMLRDHDGKRQRTTKEKLQDYTEMFFGHGHHTNPSRILVYGRPGIGKTTFTQKIAVDWTRDKKEILKKFDVLLVINLRNDCGSQDFPTMLKTAELLSADDPRAFHRLDKYVRDNQDKVLLVLDGYDEYVYSAGQSSPVHEIWRGKILRNCCVVITTRPVKEEELRKMSHVQLELNGFDSEEQVKKFASKFLSDQGVAGLVKYLQEQDLWGMVEIPLLLLMLCLVWKDLEGQLRSRADLFERFLLAILQHRDSKVSDKVPHDIGEYRGDFSKLGELAFYALLEERLYLRLSEWPDDVDVNKFINSGVFQTSKPLSSTPEKNVHFLHKSFQEFFAAQFIADELAMEENETSTCLSEVESLDAMMEMVEVLKFVCELSSDAARAVFSHLQRIGEEEGLTEYNFPESPYLGDFSLKEDRFISICTDCLFCCAASDRQALLPLFLECVHGVVILRPEQVPIGAREHLLRSTSSFAPEYVFFDYLDKGTETVDDNIFSVMCDLNTAVVTCSGEDRELKKYDSLRVMHFFLKKKGEQMLLCLNQIYKNPFRALPTDLLTELTSAPVCLDDLSSNQDNILRQTGQHCLSFVGEITVELATSEDITIVNKALPYITRPKKIKIDGTSSTSCEAAAGLIANICFTDCLHSLKLIEIRLTAKCATQIAGSLHQAPNLRKLDLSWNPLCSSVSDLARNLHHVPELTKLKLRYVQMGVKECVALASSLSDVNKLQVLDIRGNPLGHGIMALAEHLNCLPELTALRLARTEIGEKEATAVAQCLRSLSKLKMIDLSCNQLGHRIIELTEQLKCLTGLTELELYSTDMGEREATAVAGCLPSLSQLKKLDLSGNTLGHGIVQLAERLNCVPNLTDLLLLGTHMGKEQVSVLARALKHVPKLRTFDLSSNPLGRGVRVVIQYLSSVPELRELILLDVKMTKKEVEDLGAAGGMHTDYHIADKETGGYRLCSEAELKAGGRFASGIPVTFDDE